MFVASEQTSDDNNWRTLLFESVNREKELKRLLDEQLIKNDQLQLQLEMERRKTVKGLKSFGSSFGSF